MDCEYEGLRLQYKGIKYYIINGISGYSFVSLLIVSAAGFQHEMKKIIFEIIKWVKTFQFFLISNPHVTLMIIDIFINRISVRKCRNEVREFFPILVNM